MMLQFPQPYKQQKNQFAVTKLTLFSTRRVWNAAPDCIIIDLSGLFSWQDVRYFSDVQKN